MGFRFQKRIRIFKGLTIHLSKSGASLSIGGPGASVNLSERGTKTTVGLPGTGVSYSQMDSVQHKAPASHESVEPQEHIYIEPRKEASWPTLVFGGLILVTIGYLIARMIR